MIAPTPFLTQLILERVLTELLDALSHATLSAKPHLVLLASEAGRLTRRTRRARGCPRSEGPGEPVGGGATAVAPRSVHHNPNLTCRIANELEQDGHWRRTGGSAWSRGFRFRQTYGAGVKQGRGLNTTPWTGRRSWLVGNQPQRRMLRRAVVWGSQHGGEGSEVKRGEEGGPG